MPVGVLKGARFLKRKNNKCYIFLKVRGTSNVVFTPTKTVDDPSLSHLGRLRDER